MTSEYAKRLNQLRSRIDSTLVLTSSKNIYYYSGLMAEGIERLIAFVSTPEKNILLVPSLHTEEALELKGDFEVLSWNDSQNPVKMLMDVLSNSKNISLESTMKAGLYAQLPGKKDFLDKAIDEMRSVKDDHEINLMKKASEIAEKSFNETMPLIEEGITESRVAMMLEQKFMENGAQKIAFPTIVGFGKNGANPHHTPDQTKLQRGDGIIIDFGCTYKHYNSDTTRTLFLGQPAEEFQEVYCIVRDAQTTGCEFLKEGVSGIETDSAVRSVIEKGGFGEHFIHRTGHGIGLDVHESPFVDQNNNKPFKSGNCVSVEPGIYLPGKFGVRIEDILAVQPGKAMNFNTLSKDLVVL